MDELLALREGDGTVSARNHVDGCEECRAELDLIGRRAAALRALPARRPPRDRWPVVKDRAMAERRRVRVRRTGLVALAAAATLTLALVVRGVLIGPDYSNGLAAAAYESTDAELARLVEQSQRLEAALRDYGPEGRVLSAQLAGFIAELEDRIALVDAGIVQARVTRDPEVVELWRDRVSLMGALVNAHVSRTAYVGF